MALFTFLVEDNRTIRENLIPALEDLADATVVGTAETESDAVHWLGSHPDDWQLLIVDLFLKEGSGLGVLRSCLGRPSFKRVVVLSNYINADIRARCHALAADAVFDKSRELEAFFDYCNRGGRQQSPPH
jgi:DNA-binding NarL/FixJ family response regulator